METLTEKGLFTNEFAQKQDLCMELIRHTTAILEILSELFYCEKPEWITVPSSIHAFLAKKAETQRDISLYLGIEVKRTYSKVLSLLILVSDKNRKAEETKLAYEFTRQFNMDLLQMIALD